MNFRISSCNIVIILSLFYINSSSGFSLNNPYGEFFLSSDTLQLNNGTDPSQPVSRIDFQNNFYWDWFELKDDRYYNSLQLNGGKTFFEGQLYLYLRIPLITTNLTFETQTGFGDISFEVQYSTNQKNKLNFVAGTELIFPTGSSYETGLGKFIAGPYAGIINYFKSGYYGLIITDYFSFAGQSNRNDIHELSINPLFNINLGKRWYTLITPEIIYTYESGKFFVPYTQEFGKMFTTNFTASVKAGVHLKNNNKYDVLAEMKFSFLL